MGMLTLKKSKAKGPLVAGLPPFAPVPMQHGLPLGSSSRNSSAGVAVGSSSDMLLQDDTAGMQGGTVLSGSSMPPAGSSIAAGDNGGSSSSGGVITSSMGHALADSNGFPVGAGTTPAVLLAAVCNAVVGAAALCGTGVEASGCAHVTLAASLVLGHKRHGVHLSEGAGLRMEVRGHACIHDTYQFQNLSFSASINMHLIGNWAECS